MRAAGQSWKTPGPGEQYPGGHASEVRFKIGGQENKKQSEADKPADR